MPPKEKPPKENAPASGKRRSSRKTVKPRTAKSALPAGLKELPKLPPKDLTEVRKLQRQLTRVRQQRKETDRRVRELLARSRLMDEQDVVRAAASQDARSQDRAEWITEVMQREVKRPLTFSDDEVAEYEVKQRRFEHEHVRVLERNQALFQQATLLVGSRVSHTGGPDGKVHSRSSPFIGVRPTTPVHVVVSPPGGAAVSPGPGFDRQTATHLVRDVTSVPLSGNRLVEVRSRKYRAIRPPSCRSTLFDEARRTIHGTLDTSSKRRYPSRGVSPQRSELPSPLLSESLPAMVRPSTTHTRLMASNPSFTIKDSTSMGELNRALSSSKLPRGDPSGSALPPLSSSPPGEWRPATAEEAAFLTESAEISRLREIAPVIGLPAPSLVLPVSPSNNERARRSPQPRAQAADLVPPAGDHSPPALLSEIPSLVESQIVSETPSQSSLLQRSNWPSGAFSPVSSRGGRASEAKPHPGLMAPSADGLDLSDSYGADDDLAFEGDSETKSPSAQRQTPRAEAAVVAVTTTAETSYAEDKTEPASKKPMPEKQAESSDQLWNNLFGDEAESSSAPAPVSSAPAPVSSAPAPVSSAPAPGSVPTKEPDLLASLFADDDDDGGSKLPF
jgi:hypothetical protein